VAKPSEISPKLEQTRLRPEALRARDFAAVRLAILTRHSSFGATAVHPRGKPRGILAKANNRNANEWKISFNFCLDIH